MASTAAAVAGLLVILFFAEAAGAAFPGRNGRIVFASDRDGDQNVFVMNPDGSGETRLTTAVGEDDYPFWSPDGTQIVFSSSREGNRKIFTMGVDGSAQTRITDSLLFNDEEPAWSRSGNKIAFRSDRELGLQIWTINANGTGLVRLTGASDAEANFNPVWSPNADRIAFTSDRDGDWDIYTMDAFGLNVVPMTSNTALDSNPDWSPSGTKIAYQSNVDGDFDIWVTDGAGPPTQLTNDPAFDSAPTWSPDGTKIAFQSNRDGDFEIYTMNADGTGLVQLTHNTSVDRVADWQPLVLGGGDEAPPALALPGPIVVDATRPTGAVVAFTVTATDLVDPAPTLTCSHTSGLFPIGTTAVTCTAKDRAGNTSTGSFSITVRGASEQIERLLQNVIASTGLRASQKTALTTRLHNLLANFDPDDRGDRFVSCTTLGTFAILVSAWKDRPIPRSLADAWLADSRRIRDVLNC